MRIDKLISDRVAIRSYEVEDKEFCTDMWFDEENGKYLSDPTKEYLDDVYQEAVDTLQDVDYGYYFVIEDAKDGKRLGTCCAFPDDNGTNIDIGYCINKKYWRNGLATDAVSMLIDWARQQSMKTITAEVAKENAASCGLLKKLGFNVKKETTFKKYNMGIEYDSYIFEYNLEEPAIEEIPVENIGEFWDAHIKYLVEDEIITDEEDIEYFKGSEYRGTIEIHMKRGIDRHHLIYFKEAGKRIGAASYTTYKSEDGKCYILDFWVFPEYRGNGTGHRCFEALKKYTKANGAKYYEINSEKEDSVRFWKSFGFVENGKDEWDMPLFILK